MVKWVPATPHNDNDFEKLQQIKEQTKLSWPEFVAKAILEYGENHSGDE